MNTSIEVAPGIRVKGGPGWVEVSIDDVCGASGTCWWWYDENKEIIESTDEVKFSGDVDGDIGEKAMRMVAKTALEAFSAGNISEEELTKTIEERLKNYTDLADEKC